MTDSLSTSAYGYTATRQKHLSRALAYLVAGKQTSSIRDPSADYKAHVTERRVTPLSVIKRSIGLPVQPVLHYISWRLIPRQLGV